MPNGIPTIRELVERPRTRRELRHPFSIRDLVIDWEKLITVLPRYCHILLIAPHHGPNDYTNWSIQGADDFFAFANPIVTVKYLRDAQATRTNVEQELKNFNPRLVVHFDHGGVNCLYGESAANTPQPVIDSANADKLKLRVVSTISCLSAAGLGPTAVSKGCDTYLGYNDLHWIITTTHQAFWNCGSMVHRMLTLGYNTKMAYNAAITTYNTNIAHYSAIGDTFTAMHLTMDRDRLTLVGSETATTCPFKLEIIRPYWELSKLDEIPEIVWPPKVFELEREMLRVP